MSEHTGIAWANSTFNPWIGCTKVSAGCKNCYAETMDKSKFSKTMGGATPEKPVSHWGPGAPRYRTSPKTWENPVKWDKRAKANGLAHRVFPSLCDPFDPEVPLRWLVDFLELWYATPHLTWLLLTKRPELAKQRVGEALGLVPDESPVWDYPGPFPPNVWFGTSVEDQKSADERMLHLSVIEAEIRFLSVEPLLEKVELALVTAGVDWVIVGGESGPGRRDCGVDAIVDVQRQCAEKAVPCFVKQDCASKPGQQGRIPDDVWAIKQFPNWRDKL